MTCHSCSDPEHEMKQDSFQYLNIVCLFDDIYSKAVIMEALLV